MKFERFINSKFFILFEYLYVLIFSNILFVLSTLLGLGIFSIFPALVSLIIVLKSFDSTTDFLLPKVFFKAFIKNYLKSMKVFLIFLIGIVLFTFNTMYFYLALQEIDSFVYAMAFYVMLFLDILLIFVVINAAFVSVYFPNLTVKKILKYSFYLLRVISFQAMILILVLILLVLIGYVVPLLSIVLLVSIYVLLMDRMIRPLYQQLVAEGVKSLDAFMYVRTKE